MLDLIRRLVGDDYPGARYEELLCQWCGQDFGFGDSGDYAAPERHAPDCPWIEARKLLAENEVLTPSG